MGKNSKKNKDRTYNPAKAAEGETAKSAARVAAEFDFAKEIEGAKCLIPVHKVSPAEVMIFIDEWKRVNIPVNIDADNITAQDVLSISYGPIGRLLKVAEEFFIADPAQYAAFLDGAVADSHGVYRHDAERISRADAMARAGGLILSYGLLLGKHMNSTR